MKYLSLLLAVVGLATAAAAQKMEASFTAGAALANDAKVLVAGTCLTPCSPTDTFESPPSVYFAANFAVRLADFKLASIHLEVPVAGAPFAKVREINDFGIKLPEGKMSRLFITPALRLKFAPGAAISPFASVGGGWGRYTIGDFNVGVNKAALQFGGGVDFKSRIPFLAFRAEVRDFVTDQPDLASFSLLPPGSHMIEAKRHNVFAGGGVVLHF